jgi:hypothetical protein
LVVQQHLEGAERQGRTQAREALRWWYRAAKTSQGRNGPTETGGPCGPPSLPTGAAAAGSNSVAGAHPPALRAPAHNQPPAPPLACNDLGCR